MRDQNRKERKVAAHTNTCKSPSWRLILKLVVIFPAEVSARDETRWKK